MMRLTGSDSGVSDTLGYIIILGILMTAIGITYVIGYPTLLNMMNSGHLQNMEKGFVILGNNVDRVMEQSTPMQNTELSLEGGTVMIVKDGLFNITCKNLTDTYPTDSWPMYAIIYNYSGSSREVGYEFGATLEKYGPGSSVQGGTVLKEPQFVVGDPFIIPVVNLFGSNENKGGEGLAEVLIYGADTNLIRYDGIYEVDITVTNSEFYLAWKDYFSDLQRIYSSPPVTITVTDNGHDTVDFKYQRTTPINVIEVNKPISLEIK